MHYHRVLLDALPPHAANALDIGCGEGTLVRQLASCVPLVTGIDTDETSIRLAQGAGSSARVEYVLGDALTYPFEPESFDVVVSVAAVHHIGLERAFTRMKSLLRDGGMLGIIGLARSTTLRDYPMDLAGVVAARWHARLETYWEPPSPQVWPPPETYSQVRAVADRVLPGARYRRHAMFRYTLIWTKAA